MTDRKGHRSSCGGLLAFEPADHRATAPARALPGGQRTTGFPPGFDYNPVPRVILDAEARQFRGRNAVHANNKAFRRTNGAITGLPGLTF